MLDCSAVSQYDSLDALLHEIETNSVPGQLQAKQMKLNAVTF